MRTILSISLLALLAALSACKSGTPTKANATGKAYDVLVVMPDTLWMGPAGDTLQSILTENPMILPQPEPFHDIVQIDPQQANSLLLRQRNVILFQAGSREQPAMTVEYDVYSKPQALVRITGPSADEITDFMEANRFALQGIFDIAERDRTTGSAARFADRDIRDTIRNRFGLSINIPKGYRIRAQYPDFICVMYDTPVLTQGIVVYKYPVAGRESFTRAALIEKRNEFVRLIEGPNEGSYMRTADVIAPILSREVIHNRLWIQLDGLWDLENGFMGGPFMNFSTLDTTTGEVVAVDLYVLAPSYPKRNYLKFLEGIMHTARIPGDTAGSVQWADIAQNQTDTLQ